MRNNRGKQHNRWSNRGNRNQWQDRNQWPRTGERSNYQENDRSWQGQGGQGGQDGGNWSQGRSLNWQGWNGGGGYSNPSWQRDQERMETGASGWNESEQQYQGPPYQERYGGWQGSGRSGYGGQQYQGGQYQGGQYQSRGQQGRQSYQSPQWEGQYQGGQYDDQYQGGLYGGPQYRGQPYRDVHRSERGFGDWPNYGNQERGMPSQYSAQGYQGYGRDYEMGGYEQGRRSYGTESGETYPDGYSGSSSEHGSSYPAGSSSYASNRGYGPGEASSRFGTGGRQSQSYAGKGPKGYRRDDSRIKEDISEELTHHPGIDASDITVECRNGDLILTGTVQDRQSKRMAEEVAERISGVKDVQNQLRVVQSDKEWSGSSSSEGMSNRDTMSESKGRSNKSNATV